MSQSFLFIGFVMMAGFLTYFARYTSQLLVRLAAALIWLALGIWLLLGDVANLSMEDNWTKVLGFVFIIMVIVPLTWQIRTDVRHEAQVRGVAGYPGASRESWTSWGPSPGKTKSLSSLERQKLYKEKLRSKRTKWR